MKKILLLFIILFGTLSIEAEEIELFDLNNLNTFYSFLVKNDLKLEKVNDEYDSFKLVDLPQDLTLMGEKVNSIYVKFFNNEIYCFDYQIYSKEWLENPENMYIFMLDFLANNKATLIAQIKTSMNTEFYEAINDKFDIFIGPGLFYFLHIQTSKL